MSSKKLATAILLAAIVVPEAALAQSTVLTGKVASASSMPALIRQNPVYDTITVTAPVNSYGANQALSGQAQALGQQRLPLQSGVQTVYVSKPVYRTVYLRDNRTFFQRHPKVKAASIGAGVGAGVGALTGMISGRGVIRGAVIGAGTGAGVGLVRSSAVMRRHPIMQDVATASLAGLGLAASASRRGKRAWQGAGVGAALGLGWGLIKHGLK